MTWKLPPTTVFLRAGKGCLSKRVLSGLYTTILLAAVSVGKDAILRMPHSPPL